MDSLSGIILKLQIISNNYMVVDIYYKWKEGTVYLMMYSLTFKKPVLGWSQYRDVNRVPIKHWLMNGLM